MNSIVELPDDAGVSGREGGRGADTRAFCTPRNKRRHTRDTRYRGDYRGGVLGESPARGRFLAEDLAGVCGAGRGQMAAAIRKAAALGSTATRAPLAGGGAAGYSSGCVAR